MTDDHRLGHSQYRGATIVFKIEPVKVLMFDFLTTADIVQRFGQFEDDVSSEAFANHHVSFITENIAAFNVTNKIDMAILLKQGMIPKNIVQLNVNGVLILVIHVYMP